MFTDNTRVAVSGIGPNTGGEIISISLFFKTTETNEMVLVHYGGWFGRGEKKDIFMLTLKQGRPCVRYRSNKKNFVTSKNQLTLNDGKWHQIVISMPYKSFVYILKYKCM